jgi:hypothetical protein
VIVPPVVVPEEPMRGGGAYWAAPHTVYSYPFIFNHITLKQSSLLNVNRFGNSKIETKNKLVLTISDNVSKFGKPSVGVSYESEDEMILLMVA